MTAEELFKIIESFDLSLLDNPEFQEDAVREEIVNPIIKGLGYSPNKPNQIIRSRKLLHPWFYIGSKREKIYIIPDYILEVNGKPVWILDAKSPSEAIIKSSNVEQAYSYAIHRDVRVNFFALCNGREFAVYDTLEANLVLHFPIKKIPLYWKSLKKILSPEKGEELDNMLEIREYDFNLNVTQSLRNNYHVINNYPVVYMLSGERSEEMYIGETTNVNERMLSHLEKDVKNSLSKLHLITSSKFHISATADLKSKLIMYVFADGQYRLLNKNIGLCDHNYYEKEGLYKDLFKLIWNKLRAIGISRHSIEEIDNCPLFKYSPYKNLTHDQIKGLLAIMRSLLNDSNKSTIVEGGAGTGKTLLAIFLFKLLNSDNEDFNFKEFGSDEMRIVELVRLLKQKYPNPKMALIVPMISLRSTLKKTFANVKGLSAKMVISPTEVASQHFDIVLVDESHRLRRRVNLGPYFGAFDQTSARLHFNKSEVTELDWILKQSTKTILFYDKNQSIKPSDINRKDFTLLTMSMTTCVYSLKSQLRVKGGSDYIKYINKLLNCSFTQGEYFFNSPEYEFLLFDSIEHFVEEIKLKEKEYGLSRLIAGYSWKWVSKNDKNLFDIEIDKIRLKWNSSNIKDWINSANAVNEVGSIHTTQGYDLNYAGVILGKEITYNKEENEIVILRENYCDINGKLSISNPKELKAYILNIYSTLLKRGIKGTYVYVCDPNLREYFKRHIPTAKIR